MFDEFDPIPGEAAQFVKSFSEILTPQDSFLIAIDSRAHPADAIRAAYDDAAGVTSRFALNIITAANRLFGRDIMDQESFSWRPFYNEVRLCLLPSLLQAGAHASLTGQGPQRGIPSLQQDAASSPSGH